MTVRREGKSPEELVNDLLSVMGSNLEKGMKMIEADAKLTVGVDTGALRQSITSNVKSTKNTVKGTVGSNLDYAFFHSLQNPYLENAVDKNLEQIKRMLMEGVGE